MPAITALAALVPWAELGMRHTVRASSPSRSGIDLSTMIAASAVPQASAIRTHSAPSRASTLFNYVGLDEAIIDYVCEIQGSLKIGKCMPGTEIPVVEESRLFTDQPECAIIFSWHIADELAPKLRAKGYKGMLVSPLPVPRAI